MSEGTMVVTAPPVSSGGAPAGFGSYNPGGATSVPPGQAQAQMFHEVLNGSFFNSQNAVDYVNKNDLTSLLQWVKNNCYLNDCIVGPAMGTTGISAMAGNGAQWRDWQLGNMSDQLSGGP